jgi:DNA-binding NtrC family response regulator
MAPHVLVVDDDEQICRMLTVLFEAEGWTVTTASSGAAANVLIRGEPFDVVVTDLRMEARTRGSTWPCAPVLVSSRRRLCS